MATRSCWITAWPAVWSETAFDTGTSSTRLVFPLLLSLSRQCLRWDSTSTSVKRCPHFPRARDYHSVSGSWSQSPSLCLGTFPSCPHRVVRLGTFPAWERFPSLLARIRASAAAGKRQPSSGCARPVRVPTRLPSHVQASIGEHKHSSTPELYFVSCLRPVWTTVSHGSTEHVRGPLVQGHEARLWARSRRATLAWALVWDLCGLQQAECCGVARVALEILGPRVALCESAFAALVLVNVPGTSEKPLKEFG
jgi:hypothetical protein